MQHRRGGGARAELLSPDQVAIFYQTPGRCSGEDGSWLDKQYLITAGARAAGALCVWQKIVLFQDSVGRMRGGVRAGWVTMLCFSKRVRVPGDHQTVDVLADRGHMAYAHAMGEDACAAAHSLLARRPPKVWPSKNSPALLPPFLCAPP